MADTFTRISQKEDTMSSSAYSQQYPREFAASQANSAAKNLTTHANEGALHSTIGRLRGDSTYQGYLLLRVGFAVAPILFGLDKFANVLVDWEQYLAPWIVNIIPVSASDAMHVVGAVEILAGVAVALKPRYGAYLVAAWLGGIIVNLLTYSGYYDVALRDFGLMLGALTLARLAAEFDPPGINVGTPAKVRVRSQGEASR
jgi:uncharacterized membrane protein YphA (DoxX/SURF4 family)